MKAHFDDGNNQIAGIFAAGLLSGLALIPFVLAFELIRFAFSSKEAAIFTTFIGALIFFMVKAPSWNIQFELPFEKMLQDSGYVEES